MQNEPPEMIGYSTEEPQESPNKWMITFADLLALLLAFFILMYSMSIITAAQWESMVQSLSDQLNPAFFDDQTDFSTDKAVQRIIERGAMDLDYLDAILQEKILQDPFLRERIEILRLEGRLNIRIYTDSIFSANSASLNRDAELILFGVGNVLQQVPNKIEIYATTDEQTLQASEYPSHWELSLARAIIIGEALKKFGNSSIINAFGRTNPTYGNKSEGKANLSGLNQAGTSVVDIVVRRTVATAR